MSRTREANEGWAGTPRNATNQALGRGRRRRTPHTDAGHDCPLRSVRGGPAAGAPTPPPKHETDAPSAVGPNFPAPPPWSPRPPPLPLAVVVDGVVQPAD